VWFVDESIHVEHIGVLMPSIDDVEGGKRTLLKKTKKGEQSIMHERFSFSFSIHI
jgi:hypothetical protein